jgi:hypothetical protein
MDTLHCVQPETLALWKNSLPALTKAYQHSSYFTVAQDESGIVGYQISTGASFGAHLARVKSQGCWIIETAMRTMSR